MENNLRMFTSMNLDSSSILNFNVSRLTAAEKFAKTYNIMNLGVHNCIFVAASNVTASPNLYYIYGSDISLATSE